MENEKTEIISAKYITEQTNHMEYQPGMDNIGSEVQDEVISRMNAYDADAYTAADVLRALRKDVLSPEDFGALLSPAALPFLEQMAQRCPDAEIVGPVRLENYELRFRGSGFATVAPRKGSVVHGLVWKITPNCEQSLDRYEGYPRHYTKETVTVKDAAGAEIPVMVYIMAEPYCRQPALPSPYYYRVIQRGFEANGLPVESLQAAWSRTIDEVWSGRIDKPKRAPERNRGPER